MILLHKKDPVGFRIVQKFLFALLSLVLIFASLKSFGQAASAQEEFSDGPGNYYNYAPSYIQTSSTERYMCVCRNKDENVVKDHIMLRKSTFSNGTWAWGSPQVALAPSTNADDWDALHVCDPEIRKSTVTYNGQTYTWVMFYLGVKLYTEKQNQVGVAFANSPEGPWVKYSGNPIITSPSTDQWGVGQPTATNVDGNGRFLLFYTRGDAIGSGLYRRDVNLGNMSNPNLGTEVKVFNTGLTDKDGVTAPSLQGAAISYEPNTDRFYIIRGHTPFGQDGQTPSFISDELEIAYTAGSNIWNNSGTWYVDGYINLTNTGKSRNFDAGLLTDPSGILNGGVSNYTPSYAVSNLGGGFNWSYRMWRIAKDDLIKIATFSSGSIYQLEPKNAPGMRLNETGLVPDANVDIFTANSSATSQQWKFIDDGGGYYQLEPQSDAGKRLDVSGAGTTAGTNISVWYENGNNAQKWKITDVGNGYYELEPKNAPGFRLDVAGAGTTNNTNVHLWSQNGNDAQKWKITLAGSTSSSIASGSIYEFEPKNASGKRLDVANSADANGTNVHIYENNSTNAQAWKLADVGGGYYELIPQVATGRRLDVSGAGTANGTNINIWETNNNDAQKWKLIDAGSGYYELEPKNAPGKRLDVSGAGTTNGTNVNLWEQNNNDAQKWKPILKSSGARVAASEDGTSQNAEAALSDSKLMVYPNPSSDDITILHTPTVSGNIAIGIYNSQGIRLHEVFESSAERGVSKQFTIKRNTLSAGLYIIRLDTPTGAEHKKVVVQ